MLGETWEFYEPTEGAIDELGEPTKSYTKWTVENVLTKVATNENLGSDRPNGFNIVFVLALPKDRPSGLDVTKLKGGYAVPLAPNRDCGKYLIVGEPQEVAPCPTAWNVTIRVGRSDG